MAVSGICFSESELAHLFRNTEGELEVLQQLVPLVYHELRRMAHLHLTREGQRRMLNTTELVHEAYIKLEAHGQVAWENRNHFFGIAARIMRCILIDEARKANAKRRGQGQAHLSLDVERVAVEEQSDMLLALDEALTRLGELNPRHVLVVECRFFGGLTIEETAQALGVSPATVKNDWGFAKTWLYNEMTKP